MIARRPSLVGAVICAILALGGCASAPTPAATNPPFANEEEAFAAAEATYRAYVDALNQVDLSDPATFEPVFALTTGDSNANDRRSFSQMSAKEWTVSGMTIVKSFEGQTFDGDSPAEIVGASACIDVHLVELRDLDGTSQVSPHRDSLYSLALTFSYTTSGLAIISSTTVEDSTCSAG